MYVVIQTALHSTQCGRDGHPAVTELVWQGAMLAYTGSSANQRIHQWSSTHCAKQKTVFPLDLQMLFQPAVSHPYRQHRKKVVGWKQNCMLCPLVPI